MTLVSGRDQKGIGLILTNGAKSQLMRSITELPLGASIRVAMQKIAQNDKRSLLSELANRVMEVSFGVQDGGLPNSTGLLLADNGGGEKTPIYSAY